MAEAELAVRHEAKVGDAAVQARTGRTWAEWFAILDAAGARALNHRQIVALVGEHHPDDGWWQQMVTVTYEQARGLRAKHEKPEGFQISRSKTVSVPLSTLYAAWADPVLRNRWLGDEPIVVRTCAPDKSFRALWSDGRTTIAVLFYAKGAGRGQLALQHSKLASAEDAAAMQAAWGERLDRLKTLLEA